jgi:RNA-directed DNA polymerase
MKWIDDYQKKLIAKYIQNYQTYLSILITKKKSSLKILQTVEFLLNSIIVQIYAVETFCSTQNSLSDLKCSVNLQNSMFNKLRFLQTLKTFGDKVPFKLKKVWVINKVGRKQQITIFSTFDQLVQQLFVIILDPIIEAKLEQHSYGLRKGRSFIMLIGNLKKNLHNKLEKNQIKVNSLFIWKAVILPCTEFIDYNWVLDSIFLPNKYKYILKNWLDLQKCLYDNTVILSAKPVCQVKLIPALTNLVFNGLQNLVHVEILNQKKILLKNNLKSMFLRTPMEMLYSKDSFYSTFFRYVDHFILICSSYLLLYRIKKRIKFFLLQKKLQVDHLKSQTFLFDSNKPFDFLGYTFIYLPFSKYKKNKLLHKNESNSRLKLFVHPSKLTIKSLKIRLKSLMKKSQNASPYLLIAILNPCLINWLSCYAFSNVYGVLILLRDWLYKRLIIWAKRKHPKVSLATLRTEYFSAYNFFKRLESKVAYGFLKILKRSIQIKSNNLNFYGVKEMNCKTRSESIVFIKALFCPTSLKTVLSPKVFVPNIQLLSHSYYLNRSKWLKRNKKLSKYIKSIKDFISVYKSTNAL